MNIKKYFETIFNTEIAEEVNLNWNGIKDFFANIGQSIQDIEVFN